MNIGLFSWMRMAMSFMKAYIIMATQLIFLKIQPKQQTIPILILLLAGIKQLQPLQGMLLIQLLIVELTSNIPLHSITKMVQ